MGNNIGTGLIAGFALGAFVANADRITDNFSAPSWSGTSQSADNSWKKEPLILQQDAFHADIVTFANTIKAAMPPRDQALKQHRAIDAFCSEFSKAALFNVEYAFRSHSKQAVDICLIALETAAVETKTKYDTAFAQQAADYVMSGYANDKTPPVLKR